MKYEKKTIATYLNKISESSNPTYRSIIKGYFNIIKEDPEKYIVTDFEFLDNSERKDILKKYYADLNKYSNAIKKIPPKTIIISNKLKTARLNEIRICIKPDFSPAP